MRVVLYQPEIPPNTANIARTCAGLDVELHLVKPLGFELSRKQLERAGLEFWDHLKLVIHEDFSSVEHALGAHRLWVFSTQAVTPFWDVQYEPGDMLLFGRETKGLPSAIKEKYRDGMVTIPHTGNIRSINLSNAVSIGLYEAHRQINA